MTEIADRFVKVASAFGARVRAVPAGAWDNAAPCEGWVARDVVRHLLDWIPSVLYGGAGVPMPELPSVDDDPVAAWEAFVTAVVASLNDPEIATREFDTPPGRVSFEGALNDFATSDVLLHTWDLARATGLDEHLDPGEVHRLFVEMQPHDEALRTSGHFGPKVAVADDADEQTRLLAFIGRRV